MTIRYKSFVARLVIPGLLVAQGPPSCVPKVVVGRSITDSGDGGPATAAQLYAPRGFSRDTAGNLYFADSGNHRIRVISKDGTIQTVAGTGVAGNGGDGSAAISSQVNDPVAVIATGQREVYFAERGGNRVRKVLASGAILTVAGTGQGGFAGDGGPATKARINGPGGIALDRQGNLYISDTGNHRVRRVSEDGTIQTIAGSGPQRAGQTGDGQPAGTAFIDSPRDLALGADGTLYIAAYFGILSVTPDGVLHYLTQGYAGAQPSEGKPASQAYVLLPWLALDAQGAVLFATGGGAWRIAADGKLHYVMDTYQGSGLLSLPDGTMIRSNDDTEQIVRYTPGTSPQGSVGSSEVIAGQAARANTGDGGPGTLARMNAPLGLATDSKGNLYIADAWAGRIRKLDTSGTITTIAGIDGTSATPDGTPALKAVVDFPTGIAVNSSNEVFYAEKYSNLVRKIKGDGTVVTVAGNGRYPSPAYSLSDPRVGGKATSAAIHPDAIALDGHGSLYISDSSSSAIWLVTTDGILKLLVLNSGGTVPASILSMAPGGSVYFVDFQGNLFRSDAGLKPVGVKKLVNFDQSPFAVDDTGSLYLTGVDSVLYRYSATGKVQALTRLALPPLQVDASAAAFDRSGNLFVADNGRARVVALPSASTCAATPTPFVSATVNAASYKGSNLATPGEIVQIFGTAVGAEGLVQGTFDSEGYLPIRLSGTQVLVDGAPAPLLYTSAAVTAPIIPFAVESQDFSTLQVSVNGVLSNPYRLQIQPSVSGIFTNDASGAGQGAILNQDYSRNSPSKPARKGTAVAVYTTGLGAVSPPVADGALTPGTPSSLVQSAKAMVDGQAATVLYSGTAPGLVAGVNQVNIVIPESARSGNVPIVIYFGTLPGNYVTQANVTVAVE